MANLEVQIGADSSQFQSEINKVEKELKKLESQKQADVKLGIDTSNLNKSISEAKTKLEDLKKSANSMAQSFGNSQKPIANAGNTLTNFSRIAQDAPFGIIGIGNNLTATAEAFSSLSKQSGGAGNALKAVASSLMGGGGILLAISLVTTGLTIMAQKGLTVSDVFNKLTGNFDAFKKELQDVNKEAAKNAAEQVQSVKAYTSAAKDINLSMQERLIAVKKLQDEYPAYFGNLTKEQILSGNVALALKDVTDAIKAKAKAQAYAGKLGDLAAKEVDLEEQKAILQEKANKATAKTQDLLTQIGKNPASEQLANRWVQAGRDAQGFVDDLKDVEKELLDVQNQMTKWAAKSTVQVKASVKLDFEPEKAKKAKKPKVPKKVIDNSARDLMLELANERQRAMDLIAPVEAPFPFIIPAMDEKFQAMLESMKAFGESAKSIITGSIAETFGLLGTSIGEALASGGNVLAAIGTSILQGLGNFLSDMGGLLIQYGTLAVVKGTLDTAILAGGPLSIAAGLAAIGVGTALKAAGGAIGSFSKSGGSASSPSVSAGNSVSTPTSSVNSSGGGSGWGNVVFEISGQSLVGVLSNTLNKNTKLGGAMPAI